MPLDILLDFIVTEISFSNSCTFNYICLATDVILIKKLKVDILELTYWEVDILGVDILGVDIPGVDILRLTQKILHQ